MIIDLLNGYEQYDTSSCVYFGGLIYAMKRTVDN